MNYRLTENLNNQLTLKHKKSADFKIANNQLTLKCKQSANFEHFDLFQVALVVDRLCLLIFFLAMTIASLAILTSSPHLYTPSLSDLRKAGYGINDTAAKSTSDTIISDNHKHYEPRLPSCNVLEHVLKTGG